MKTIETAPIFNIQERGVSKITDYIGFEWSRYYLLAQKYVETHTDKQIESAFCGSLIIATRFMSKFDYQGFMMDSTMKLTFTICPSEHTKGSDFVLDPKEERYALIIQKLMDFAFGIAAIHEPTRDAIRESERKHKNKTK